MILDLLKLFILVVAQNASFTLVSRARNSKSIMYHALAAVGSNGIWLLVFRQMVQKYNDLPSGIVYIVASVGGSILMHYVAMKFFEKPKMIVQKPSPGRIVNFFGFGGTIVPAVIVSVVSETVVNLELFGQNESKQRTSVIQGNSDFQWNWPKIK